MAQENERRGLVMMNAKVPAEFMAAVTAEAARRGVSRSHAIREALANWLDAEAVSA